MAESLLRKIAPFFLFLLIGLKPSISLAADPVNAKFVSEQGKKTASFQLEVADTLPRRMAGLMYRKEMAADAGMIFIFPDMKPRSFWMKDTYLSLDMVFLNDQLEVVAVLPNVPILNTQPRESKVPAKYVIELNAGIAAQAGVTIGSKLVPETPLPVTIE